MKNKMKRKTYLTILLLLIFFISCEKKTENNEVLTSKNINFTNCKSETKKKTLSTSCLTVKAIENNFLQVRHRNTMFCCGTEEIKVDIEIKNDTISIHEIDLGPLTYCYCWHDIIFDIGPLKNKQYVLQIIGCETSYNRDSISAEFHYSNTLNFTNCN